MKLMIYIWQIILSGNKDTVAYPGIPVNRIIMATVSLSAQVYFFLLLLQAQLAIVICQYEPIQLIALSEI